MYRISPSQIGVLLECPRCLWLHFREDRKRPSGPYPSLPSGMDGVLKAYFDRHRGSGTLPPEIEGKVGGELFPEREKLDVWRNNWKGLRAVFPHYDLELKGAVDELIVLPDGSIAPLDFKTRGYPTKEDTHTSYQHQLDLYALLLRENGMRPAPVAYLLFFWPTSYELGSSQFATDVVTLSVDPRRGEEILERTSAILNGMMPPPAETCAFCAYRGGGA